MFGHKDEVETTATVIAVSQESKFAEQNAKYTVVLDVNGVDEALFRTSVEQRFLTLLQAPNPGDVVNVRYDRKHNEVEMLVKGDPRFDVDAAMKLRDQRQADAVEAALAQPPGSPPPTPPGVPDIRNVPGDFPMAVGPNVVQTSRQVIDATQVPGLRDAILSALQAHGIDVAKVEQLASSLGSQAAGGVPPAAAPPTSSPSPTAAPSDPQQRLPHLRMLRDSGLLTAEEYQALESKLLGQA